MNPFDFALHCLETAEQEVQDCKGFLDGFLPISMNEVQYCQEIIYNIRKLADTMATLSNMLDDAEAE